MRVSALLVSLLLLCVANYAQAPNLSPQLLHVEYVAFGYETAQGFIPDSVEARTSMTVTPQEIEALSNVREVMEKWKRYVTVINPSAADLLVAIRGSHHRSIFVGGCIGHVPAGSVPGSASGPVVGGDLGSPSQDYMAVYAAENGREGVQLWRKSEADGLAGKKSTAVSKLQGRCGIAGKEAVKALNQ